MEQNLSVLKPNDCTVGPKVQYFTTWWIFFIRYDLDSIAASFSSTDLQVSRFNKEYSWFEYLFLQETLSPELSWLIPYGVIFYLNCICLLKVCLTLWEIHLFTDIRYQSSYLTVSKWAHLPKMSSYYFKGYMSLVNTFNNIFYSFITYKLLLVFLYIQIDTKLPAAVMFSCLPARAVCRV